MADPRLEFQWKGEQYSSVYKNKRLSDPEHKIWMNFPWAEVSRKEKEYIKTLWERHNGKTYWPINQMRTGNEKVVSDTAKFRFFDLINLAPTPGEYAGYQKNTLDNNPEFFKSYKTPINFNNKGSIYGGFIDLPLITRPEFATFEGEKQKLRSVRFNANENYNGYGLYYDNIIKNRAIFPGHMYHPSEDEYKLSWMRDLVVFGIEGRMGPFAQVSDSNSKPLQNANNTYKFRIGDLENLLKRGYSKNRYEVDGDELEKYQYGLLYNWAKNELDWADKKYTEQYGINHKYPTYNENPFPKAPPSYLRELLDGKFKLSTSDELSLRSKQGHTRNGFVIINGINLDIQNIPDTEIQLISISLGNSGLKTTNASNFSNYDSDIEIQEQLGGVSQFHNLKKIVGIGIPPHFANDKDAANYIVSGWITIPEIFGKVKLPWPFVWKYFGLKGFRKFGPNGIGPDLTETFFKEKWAAEQGYENYYPKQTTGDDFWRYNYRLRLWWYKYSSTNLPERELLFYIRMKYGVSHAVGYRYVAYANPDLKDIFEFFIWSAYKFLSVFTVTGAAFEVPSRSDEQNYEYHRKRYEDAIISGGLPDGNRNFAGETVDEYYTSLGSPTLSIGYIPHALEKDNSGNQYYLRSMYISQVQDTVGWLRSYNNNYQVPLERSKHEIKGEESEVVKYEKTGAISGYYTFNGHGTDRFPIYDRRTYVNYKSNIRSDIKINDISLYELFRRKLEGGTRESDAKDRYSSPEQLQSYDWTCITGNCNETNGQKEVSETDKVYYNDHRVKPTFSVKDEFNPALLSPKELQFMYEAVSFILYGDTPVINPTQFLSPMSQNEEFVLTNPNTYSYLHRWDELTKKINIPLGQLGDKWYTPNVGGVTKLDIYGNWSVTLADYILWAAPTSDQYYKRKFSEINDTFLSKLRGNIEIGVKRSTLPHNFPFDALASYITESEKLNSLRPLVPAFVHHRYISRKMNDDRLVYPNGGDARGVEDIDIKNIGGDAGDSDKIQQNILRALGGVYNDNDEGILITLPTFVLGGRPDIPGGDESWDIGWGVNPFFMKDGKLLVRDFDAVIDAWARGKLHNGKYVSTMEIMFWIRYRHGLAASPTSRRILHKIPTTTGIHRGNVSDAWPKFLTNLVVDNNSAELGEYRRTNGDGKFLLPHETLNNIEMVVSYYSPILVNQYDFMCHDPLIELDTTPPSGYEDAEYAAYTGFNSYYGCYWPGTQKVTGIRKSSIFSLNDYDGNFKPSMTYPSTTAMKTEHTNHYLLIHREYRRIESGEFGFSRNKNISVTGFDYEQNEKECKKVILCSNIQSWFKAYRILSEGDKFVEYIDRGLKLPPGSPDSVLEVEADLKDGDDTGKVHLYISGEGVGQKTTTFRAKRLLSFSERMRVRPWFERLESGIGIEQQEAVNLCDDYSLGTVGCIPQYAYMRHILNPVVFMWSSTNSEVSQGGFYTYDQLDAIKATIHKTSIFWSKEGYGTGTYFGQPDPETSPPDNSKKLEYSERISGLALQSIALSLVSEKFALNPNYQKDPARSNRFTQLVNYWIFIQNQKTAWNTSVKITSLVAGGLSGVAIFDMKLTANLSEAQRNILTRANEAISNRYHTLYTISKFGKGLKFAAGGDIFKAIKSTFDFIGAGYFGWSKPGGLPEPKEYGILTKSDYKLLKPWIALIKDQAFTRLQTYVLKEGFATILAEATQTGGGRGAGQVVGKITQSVITETATGEILGSALFVTGVGLVITVGIAAIAWAVDRMQEQWENNKFYQRIWELRNEAINGGYVEGPYIESEGKILIKKTKTGEIPILGYDYGKGTGSIKNLEVTSSSNPDSFVEYVIQKNKEFYRTDGVLDQILKDIPTDSCECRFFESIFDNQTDVSIRDIQNWNSGPYKRRLKDRVNVIDEAPTNQDIPIIFKRAPAPSATTAGTRYIPIYDPTSRQQSSAQVGPNESRNIRDGGNNGTVAQVIKDCPRFWWPSLIVQSSTNLCEFIAENGKYPKRTAEYFKVCDPRYDRVFVNEYLVKERLGRISKDISEFNTYSFYQLSDTTGYYKFSRYNVSGGNVDIKYYKYGGPDIPIVGFEPGTKISTSIVYSTKNLYSKRETAPVRSRHSRNDYPLYGQGQITSEGVLGPAPPHEREIINIFRKKYKIDTVMPIVWYKNANSDAFNTIGKNPEFVYNPYKQGRPLSKNGWLDAKSFCCSVGEILGEDPSPNDIDSLSKRRDGADYCEYLITLNTPQFREKILNHCRGKKDNSDRTSETQQTFSEVLPVPNSPDPRPEPPDEEYPESKTPDCQSCDDDRRNDEPIINTPNPRLPNCTNCDTNRPFLVELKKILPEVLRTPSRLREAFNQGSNTAFFNGIVFEWEYYEIGTERLGNPLMPGDRKLRSGWRLKSFSSFANTRSEILKTNTTRYRTTILSSRRPDLDGSEWSS